MKITSSLKLSVLLLSFLLLFQNCRVYRSKSVAIDEAVMYPGKLKIKTTENETFKFESLQKEDGKLYGTAKRKSKTSKVLFENIINDNSNYKYVKLLLPDNFVKDIYLENKTVSTILNVSGIVYGIVLVGTALAGLILLLAWGN